MFGELALTDTDQNRCAKENAAEELTITEALKTWS